MNVKIQRLHPDAVLPAYKTEGEGAAGFDLCATEDGYLFSGESKKVGTGLAFEIPAGHVMLLFPRSGLGTKGLRMRNTAGVIDSDYRGEVMLPLEFVGNPKDHGPGDMWTGFSWNKGDRLVQGLILPIERAVFQVVDELSETDRGAAGFGSTGV